MKDLTQNMKISFLRKQFQEGGLTPSELVEELYDAIELQESAEGSCAWIYRLSREELLEYTSRLEGRSIEELPLYGIPFAIKDNIDLSGVPTTAGCPDYSYVPTEHAYVVKCLIEAGAIPFGKTNMDQFATGLVGVRSPYGTAKNVFDQRYIPGGSSSGSAVVVARGWVSFSLGTDTAGSGRIPAAFQNIVGHKPTCGLLSASGVVPACKSLDSVSIFAHSAADAECVLDVAASFDDADVYSRKRLAIPASAPLEKEFVFGVPQPDQCRYFGNSETEGMFENAVSILESMGGKKQVIDISPFLEAALLLYEGPWIAERFVAIESFLETHSDSLHPVTRAIISGGSSPSAASGFKAQYRLKKLKRLADAELAQVDFMLTPTAGTIYTKEEVEAQPIETNSNLGYYTNFMNLLDYAATAFPAEFYEGGLPFGVTAFAQAQHDSKLLNLAERFAQFKRSGETDSGRSITYPNRPDGWTPLVVCGAHLEGLALNWQLTTRGARLWKVTKTAPVYQFFALPPVGETIPPRPGVIRDEKNGVSLSVEVWLVPTAELGGFVENIPAPLGIGKIDLIDGRQYSGFLCEHFAVEKARNISHLADWRLYMRA